MGPNRRSTSDDSCRNNNNMVVKVCVAVLAVLILLAIVFLINFGAKTTEVTVTKNAVATAVSVDEFEGEANHNLVDDKYIYPKFPVKLSSVRVSLNEGELDFDFSLSSWTAYIVDFKNDHKALELTLYNTNVLYSSAAKSTETNSDDNDKDKNAESPSSQPVYSRIVNGLKVLGDIEGDNVTIEHYNHNRDTILRINFPYSVHLVKSKIMKGHPSSLFLNFRRTENPKIVTDPGQISTKSDGKEKKAFVDYNDDPEAIYDTAKNLLYFKKYEEAIDQLESNPMVTLENDKAAAMLTKIYIIKKDYAKAQKLGARSLELFPLNVELRRLLAQVYFIEKDYKKSQEILQASSPEMRDHLDYYELLAGVMLKVKNYDTASGVYRKMLTINSNKSDWWAGLGITLQAQGKINLALESYNRALRINNMDANLLGYVKSQISILQ
jgi:tetratricopeptide (TPR) repeat protein